MNISLLLFTLLLISLILNYLELNDAKTAIEIVNDMGIGINLGNLFDCYDISKEIKTPNDQLTLLGNSIPKKETIKKLKTSGIKTIRLPITWINFINETGIVSTEWMNQVKEIVQLIINYNMYCIINIHHDGAPGNWLSKGLDSKAQFDLLWTQISNEFKDFDDHLIFEAMNEVEYKIGDKYDYSTLLILTQSFIDIVRNSGGNNYERLLLIPGANDDYQLTISDEFQIPIDPANTFAISIHYYIPYEFTKQLNNDENLTDNPSRNTWGNALDYDEAILLDKRNFCEYYTSLIKNNHPLVFSFGLYQDYNSKILKMFLFFFSFSLDLTVNALFFSDDTMHKIYEDKGKFNFLYQIPQILYSTLISKFIDGFIRKLALSQDNIVDLKQEKENLDKKYIQIKRILKIKFIFFFLISFVVLLFFWYYIVCFCGIYANTQIHLIKDSAISLLTGLFIPLAMYLIPTIFRISALKAKKPSRAFLYKLSSFVENYIC